MTVINAKPETESVVVTAIPFTIPVGFPFLDNTLIVQISTDDVFTELGTNNFTVASDRLSVTITGNVDVGRRAVVFRRTELSQELDLVDFGEFFAQQIED